MRARRPSLAALLWLSLALGVTAFGGGFALVQRLKRVVVRWRSGCTT